jgi:hypothetical protein
MANGIDVSFVLYQISFTQQSVATQQDVMNLINLKRVAQKAI